MNAPPPGPPLRILMMCSVRWFNACAAYAVEISRTLLDRGHEIRLLVKPESPLETEAGKRAVPTLTSMDLTSLSPDRVFSELRSLRRVIEEFDPHIVNAHRSEDHLFAAMALRRSGRPLVRTRGDVRPPRTHLANRFLYLRGTRSHIVAADFMPERFYTPLGVPGNRVAVVRPGFPVSEYAAGAAGHKEAGKRLNLPGSGPVIGLVGRLTRNKGHATLIEAFARVRTKPEPRLLLSGEEFEIRREDLLEQARELAVADRVHISPRANDVRDVLMALDVLAVPSVASEAISRIAMEGLALGVPTVASSINSLPEVIGDAGLLVPPRDPQALSCALERLLGDRELRQCAADRGPARIRRRYDPEIQLARTETVFYRALEMEPA